MTCAWHFVGETLRDGSPIPADGEWLEHAGPVKMCESGLHFSDTPAHALQYAPGATLCYVEVQNVLDRDDTKGVCTRRRIIARGDATEALRYFARMQALIVIHLWDAPDVVCDYLMTGDESIRDAARSAARDAAWSAACAAARSAACAAARSAAWDAARSAARAAAMDAARDAAWDAAWDAACAAFNELIYECFEDVITP